MTNRDTNADIIRIFALFMVFFVHIFYNNGFYALPIDNTVMYVGTFFRQFFLICVPLFMLLTGYLQGNKEIEFNKKYVFKLNKVLVPYLIITILTVIFHRYTGINSKTAFLDLLFAYYDNGYTWYIEMYIGLYLLIPFFNQLFISLNKKKREGLIVVLSTLTFIPSLFFVFDIPFINCWTMLYPISYYFIGAYIKLHGLNIKRSLRWILLITSCIYNGILATTLFQNSLFSSFNDSNGFFTAVNSVLIFSLLLEIKTDRFKLGTKKLLANLSNIVVPTYMFSYISDNIIYQQIVIKHFPNFVDRMYLAIPFALLSGVIAFCGGWVTSIVSNVIIKTLEGLLAKIKK